MTGVAALGMVGVVLMLAVQPTPTLGQRYKW